MGRVVSERWTSWASKVFYSPRSACCGSVDYNWKTYRIWRGLPSSTHFNHGMNGIFDIFIMTVTFLSHHVRATRLVFHLASTTRRHQPLAMLIARRRFPAWAMAVRLQPSSPAFEMCCALRREACCHDALLLCPSSVRCPITPKTRDGNTGEQAVSLLYGPRTATHPWID